MSASFSDRLLAWYDREGRRDLPWQLDRTPYRVWVSEIMLQQTRARTVVPYFERFVASFPTVRVLAAASPNEVLRLWAGLGYYARGRNLHLAARQLCEQFNGELPSRYELLRQLPGIGRSTAGAILALCFNQTFPILDGNVKRILARHRDIEGWPGKAEAAKRLWALSAELLPRKRMADYTQAIMDLGAMLCTPAQPRCGDCPVSSDCRARIEGRVADRPTPAPRRRRPVRSVAMLMITYDNEVLLQRRPATGIWGGLLCLPEIGRSDDALNWCRRQVGVGAEVYRWSRLHHEFTHFGLDIYPVGIRLRERPRNSTGNGNDFIWYKICDASHAGVPAPVGKLLAKLALPATSEECNGT